MKRQPKSHGIECPMCNSQDLYIIGINLYECGKCDHTINIHSQKPEAATEDRRTEKMAENITWDEAVSSGGFIKLEEDKMKTIKIKNWTLVKVEKFGKESVEFVSDCFWEDGKEVDKKFTTTSNRLKGKLKTVLENKNPTTPVSLSILKIGDKFDTRYSLKEEK